MEPANHPEFDIRLPSATYPPLSTGSVRAGSPARHMVGIARSAPAAARAAILDCDFGAADERLWAEALNLGAYDVLAKPFDRTEVMRVVSMAWMHWSARYVVAPERSLVTAGGAA